jgi:hypothetical protein
LTKMLNLNIFKQAGLNVFINAEDEESSMVRLLLVYFEEFVYKESGKKEPHPRMPAPRLKPTTHLLHEGFRR